MKLKKKYLLNVFVLFLVFSCSHLNINYITSLDDKYFSNLVTQMTEQKKSILNILESKNPSLYNQIINDSKEPSLLGFWGQSLNFDSGAKKKILDDQIISDLQAQFGIKNDNMIVHAGVTHTYGYLFSVLQTPYGYKRKRWIEPTLNYAFSFSKKDLSPESLEGGLLSNITYFTGMLAFKSSEDQKALSSLKNVSKDILHFDYHKILKVVLEEQIMENHVLGPLLRTTLIRFPTKRFNEENDYLLIYSIISPQSKKELLITAFPIKEEAYKSITTPTLLGVDQPIVIRYNAYLEGLMGKKLSGLRKI